MKIYSQRDLRWANEKLGTCTDTIGKSGCKITCLASFCGKTPTEVNSIIPYVNGCLTNDETAAKALGLYFGGKSTTKPDHDCIAETNHYKSKGVPQHFFILLADGTCVDPLDLDPKPKKNPYNIVSYRLFKPLEQPMNKDFIKAIEKIVSEDYGDNLNEKEQKDAAKKLIDQHDLFISASQNVEHMMVELQEANNRINTLAKEAEEFREQIQELVRTVKYKEFDIEQLNEALESCANTSTLDKFTLTEIAGAFFRKLINVKK